MVSGTALEFTAKAGPGDFICGLPYVLPDMPHQKISASATETLQRVLVRSDGEAEAINLDIAPVKQPKNVPCIDPIHRGWAHFLRSFAHHAHRTR